MFAELLAPGFVIFFFGLSAMTVGVFRFAFGDAFTLTWQFAAFSVFSVLYLVVLRRALKKVFTGEQDTSRSDFNHDYVGRIGKVTAAIEPPLSGRIIIGDSEWTAEADAPVAAGANVKVISQTNLTFKVEEVK